MSTGRCAALRVLALTSNALETLPAEIGSLASLSRLLLDDNALHALPRSIGGLRRCEALGLAMLSGMIYTQRHT